MELLGNYLLAFIETGGLFAPVLFISFHLLRPLFSSRSCLYVFRVVSSLELQRVLYIRLSG